MIPFFGRIVMARRQPQVVVVRALWLAFASAMVWIGVVVLILTSSHDATGSESLGVVAVAVATVITVVGTIWARRRRARVDPHSNDARAYRSCFFTSIAFGELPAFVGFAFALIQSRATTYFVGAVIALIAFAMVAPTRRFMAAQGPTLRLAFLTPPP